MTVKNFCLALHTEPNRRGPTRNENSPVYSGLIFYLKNKNNYTETNDRLPGKLTWAFRVDVSSYKFDN